MNFQPKAFMAGRLSFTISRTMTAMMRRMLKASVAVTPLKRRSEFSPLLGGSAGDGVLLVTVFSVYPVGCQRL
jgi:hypothetical protein